MRYYEHLTQLPAPGGSSVALGYFDGLHIGHQTVVKQAVETGRAKGLTPALLHLPPAGGQPHQRAQADVC